MTLVGLYVVQAAEQAQRLQVAARLADKAFARGHRIFINAPNREQAEALYFGGQAFLSVASLDEEAGQDELYGKILLVRCRDGFPGTEWGKKAASEL